MLVIERIHDMRLGLNEPLFFCHVLDDLPCSPDDVLFLHVVCLFLLMLHLLDLQLGRRHWGNTAGLYLHNFEVNNNLV